MASNRNLVILAVVGFLIVVGGYAFYQMGFGGLQQAAQSVLPPNVQVTSHNARTGLSGFDFTVWIDTSVYNSGGKGTVTVWAKVTQGSHQWTKSQSVYLDAKGSKNLTFEFKEPVATTGYSYSVWIG